MIMSQVAEIFETMSYGPAPESASAAEQWLAEHGRKFGLFINNQSVAPAGGGYLATKNPATGGGLAEVADAEQADVDAAVAAARAALPVWQGLSDHARARHLYALARQIQKHDRLLAVVESLDNGKPIRESRDIDVQLVARHFYYHAGWAQLRSQKLGDYVPVGVVGQVIPWNFPLLMLAWKIAPALAMGNTVVLKPAPYTPLSALLFAELVAEAGLPPGVVNIVTGGDQTGALVTTHPDVDKVAFTGSTGVGRIIRKAIAGSGKKLSLELGGKSPFVVFADADLDAAVEGVVDAIWFNQGQVCCAGSRLLVEESVADEFYKRLKRRMSKLRVGDPLDKCIDMGAIVDWVQHENIDKWVKIGLAEGAELYQPEIELPADGCFYPPTLLMGVEPAGTVAQEEIFGPVLVSMTFRTPAEAVALANNTRYGLAASVWSENINLALSVASQIKAGAMWINSTNLFDAAAGFGGYRESGYGREGGEEGLYEYLKPAWQKDLARPEGLGNVGEWIGEWGGAVPTRPSALPLVESGAKSKNGKGTGGLPVVDRTPKMYIGGKQKRPDGHYTRAICGPSGELLGQVGDGNRKDIREAVEAAHKAQAASPGWSARHGHNRAQILYFLAENLAAREAEFVERLRGMTGQKKGEASLEVETSISRLFSYAAWADKWGGRLQETTLRGVTVAVHEPLGVIGIACPEAFPLLGMVSLVAPAIARGNTTVVLPSERWPLSATDFYQVLDTSDVPGGVVNIVTGDQAHLTRTLVAHEDVDGMWYFGDGRGSAAVEYLSATNMKRTWVGYGRGRDWLSVEQGEGEDFLRQATQVKNIWVPTGE
ncbi:MAG TPA: aldehyde dehydrogenase family protein [Anaerolineae bacterium]|nr:aldehyde dehydrogenase family protein [Anaerolineae bacterium]